MASSTEKRIAIEKLKHPNELRFYELAEGRVCRKCYDEFGQLHVYELHETGIEMCGNCWRSISRDDPAFRFHDTSTW